MTADQGAWDSDARADAAIFAAEARRAERERLDAREALAREIYVQLRGGTQETAEFAFWAADIFFAAAARHRGAK